MIHSHHIVTVCFFMHTVVMNTVKMTIDIREQKRSQKRPKISAVKSEGKESVSLVSAEYNEPGITVKSEDNQKSRQDLPSIEDEVDGASQVVIKKKKYSNGAWHTHKKRVFMEHPDINGVEQIIMAKKTYKPESGKFKTPTAIHRDAWMLRNPDTELTGAARDAAIRSDLIDRI